MFGRALVYSRLSKEAAQDYDRVKLALMNRYDLTEDVYRRKFRASKPEVDESPELFIVRLERYLLRWLELSHTERSFEGLKDLIVEEQFIDSCPKELAIHLRERAPETLKQIAKIADQYLEAHGKHLFSCATKKPLVQPKAEQTKNARSDTTALLCYKCNARGHKTINCPTLERKCFLCGKQGHEARNCRSGGRKSGGQGKDGNPVQRGQVSAGCLVKSPDLNATPEEVKSCIQNDQLLLACGKKVPLLSNACVEPLTGVRSKMPVVKGRVGEVPIARIYVDTPYLKGNVEAQCLSDPIYDLLIGNVRDARDAQNPDPMWQEACAVTTRSQAKKKDERTTLMVPSTRESPIVDREKLKQMQREDEILRKYWDRDGVLVKGQAEISFEENGVLYRLYKHPYVNGGKPLQQVMVPETLRHPIMEVAHGSIMRSHGHQENKR